MKKTFNINLGGLPFIVDEDAYRMLTDYFESIRSAFSGDDFDANELVSDLESRSAEILSEIFADTGGKIVSVEYVNMLMKRLGEVDEITEQMAVDTSSVKSNSENVEAILPPPVMIKRRFYRDPVNKMLGGVCSGIAAYLNIDVVWVRLVFILLCLISLSTAFILYLVLWIVTPDANTTMRQMQLHGIQPTVDNIGKSVNNFFNGMTGAFRANAEASGNKTAHALIRVCATLGKGLLLILSIISAVGMVACVCGIFGCITAMIATALGGNGVVSELMQAIAIHDTIWEHQNPMLFFSFGLASMICGGLTLFGIFYAIMGSLRNRTISRPWVITLLTAWTISLIAVGVCRLIALFS